MKNEIKISIITPSLNQGGFIEDTIQSVLNQNYPNFEHIIMDGGSKDETLSILSKYSHLKVISEKDTGQANAINKGIKLSSGEIVAWLNSDDYYYPNILNEIAQSFINHPEIDVVYGGITFITPDKKKICDMEQANLTKENLSRCPDLIRQPSMFFRRELYNQLNGINENLDLVFDLDFFLRALKKKNFHYIPRLLSFYREYQTTKTQLRKKRQAVEIFKVLYTNKLLSFGSLIFIMRRYLQGSFLKKVKNLIK